MQGGVGFVYACGNLFICSLKLIKCQLGAAAFDPTAGQTASLALNWGPGKWLLLEDKLKEHSGRQNRNNLLPQFLLGKDPEETREIPSGLLVLLRKDKYQQPQRSCSPSLVKPEVESRSHGPQAKHLKLHCSDSSGVLGRGGDTNCHLRKWGKYPKTWLSLTQQFKSVFWGDPRNSTANAVTFGKATSSQSNTLNLSLIPLKVIGHLLTHSITSIWSKAICHLSYPP